MAEKKLEMLFKNQMGTTAKITVEDVRDDVVEVEVQNAMQIVLAKNIFQTNSGEFVSIESAKIVTTDVEDVIS